MLNRVVAAIGLATKWLRILPLDDNDKIRNHLVANPIDRTTFYGTSTFRYLFYSKYDQQAADICVFIGYSKAENCTRSS